MLVVHVQALMRTGTAGTFSDAAALGPLTLSFTAAAEEAAPKAAPTPVQRLLLTSVLTLLSRHTVIPVQARVIHQSSLGINYNFEWIERISGCGPCSL